MTSNNTPKDTIFSEKMALQDFVFDDKVAGVFEDMINRSIPGYSTIISMIGVLSGKYAQDQTNLYDLGCSLGGASFSMASQIDPALSCSIEAIDNSSAMIERLKGKIESQNKLSELINCHCDDILDAEIKNASVVVLNFTLQFVPPEKRVALLKKVFDGLNPGGLLIISEKIVFPDDVLNQLFIEMYHSFKERMGYSKLEISQKRAALENVMKPESLDTHRTRLESIGFNSFDAWFQCFNFASMVAFK